MAKTLNTKTTSDPMPDSDGLWSTGQAAAFLGIQKGSLAAAVERTPYLKDNAVKDKHPGMNINRTRLRPEDVRKFADARGASTRAGSNGMRRFSVLTTNEEKPVAEMLLSNKFGRDIKLETLWKNRNKAEEVSASDPIVDEVSDPSLAEI